MRHLVTFFIFFFLFIKSYGQIEVPSYTDFFYGFDNWFDTNDSVEIKKIEEIDNSDKRTRVTYEFNENNIVKVTYELKRFLKRKYIYHHIYHFDTDERLVCMKIDKPNEYRRSINISYDTINRDTVLIKTEWSGNIMIYKLHFDKTSNTRFIEFTSHDGHTTILTKLDLLNRIESEILIKTRPDYYLKEEYKFLYNDSYLPNEMVYYSFTKSDSGTDEVKNNLYFEYVLDEKNNWTSKVTRYRTGAIFEKERKIYY